MREVEDGIDAVLFGSNISLDRSDGCGTCGSFRIDVGLEGGVSASTSIASAETAVSRSEISVLIFVVRTLSAPARASPSALMLPWDSSAASRAVASALMLVWRVLSAVERVVASEVMAVARAAASASMLAWN